MRVYVLFVHRVVLLCFIAMAMLAVNAPVVCKAAARGLNDGVYSVVEAPDGSVYVGGQYERAGKVKVDNIAKWDGKEWAPLGSGVDGTVLSLAVDKEGNVYAAGMFTTAGGKKANGLAKWDGIAWTPLNWCLGGQDGSASKVFVASNGALYVMGDFTEGNKAYAAVAEYSSGSWKLLCKDYLLNDMTLSKDGTVYILASELKNTSGKPSVYKWNGAKWQVIAKDAPSEMYMLAASSDGLLYTSGFGGVNVWKGSKWETLSKLPFSFIYMNKDNVLCGINNDGCVPFRC